MEYLPEQIGSILCQDFTGCLSVLVRDDGSTDDSVNYLESLNDPRLIVASGDNMGPRYSFFALLQMARDHEADYIALCDQDDFWQPNKIRRAIEALDVNRPAIYASSLNLVNEKRQDIGKFIHPGNRSFVSTLFCNFITGCTCVFNRKFLDQLKFPLRPDQVIMHDWWLASMAVIDSQIVYDGESAIDYRQHSSNHVGIKTGLRGILSAFLRTSFANAQASRFRHAEQVLFSTGCSLTNLQRDNLIEFLATESSRWKRLKFALKHWKDINLRSIFRYLVFF